MVDTTPAAVCEDPVVFIIKTATNMMETKTVSQYREHHHLLGVGSRDPPWTLTTKLLYLSHTTSC